MSAIPRAVRQRVLERDEYLCRRCWVSIYGRTYSIHHRRLRSRGGDNTLANLVTLCGNGTQGCHGWIHANPRMASRLGWIVSTWANPANVPIRYRGLASIGGSRETLYFLGETWELDCEGSWEGGLA